MSAPITEDPDAEVTDVEDAVEPDGEPVEQRTAEVQAAEHGERLDRWLTRLAGEFSRNHLQSLIEGGHVAIGEEAVTHRAKRVQAGQRISVRLLPTLESQAFRPEAIPLHIVFEDAHVLVLDKPAGLVVHPAPGNWSGTLLNGVLAHHQAAATLPRAGIVHRLDKDTSGLMVVAKSLPAMTALTRAIAAREVSRQYLALAHGVTRSEAFSVEAPIGRDPAARIKMACVPGGKPARTDVFRLAWRLDPDAVSALQCTLHTGRTHQIRVHLALRGHPLVADALYGGRPAFGVVRQALHAHRLGFEHPVLGKPVAFEAPLPPDLALAWAAVAGASDAAGKAIE